MDDLEAFTCRIPAPVYRALKTYAALVHRTMGSVVTEALLNVLTEDAEAFDAEFRSVLDQLHNPDHPREPLATTT